MIKFFRHIRQRLVKENRTSKYLLYAIGEIVLVVIGILIALQINNWNEERKTNANLNKALKALKTDLVQDSLLIANHLPDVNYQYQLNESLRERMAMPKATVDTLLKITRNEFNPNWNNPIFYNTNAYKSLNDTGLIDVMNDSLKAHIKDYYNGKFYREGMVESITKDYRAKLAQYVDTYTFGSTDLHDQGKLIDSLVWKDIDLAHLAAAFQGISNFKRILFRLTKDEMEYSLSNSKGLIQHIDQNLDAND
ncbi:DUF6090 family protein [Winogradskyella ouciana]|uniref:Uncharacterized protein n=1 Tax=Winogradskyella ouciana TaxID=2608631 RepID=A0A7K1GEX6_9FLAO|nr:DUF6090 family protein [Winogradskyella ouciana]MTE27862.1 hypothetical protein [Winogradskyella ouciana]